MIGIPLGPPEATGPVGGVLVSSGRAQALLLTGLGKLKGAPVSQLFSTIAVGGRGPLRSLDHILWLGLEDHNIWRWRASVRLKLCIIIISPCSHTVLQ